MRYVLIVAIWITLAATADAAERVRKLGWEDGAGLHIVAKRNLDSDGGLVIEALAGAATIPVLELDKPGITAPLYALGGKVRYSGVNGNGYLQLDSHFAGKGTFFTKSLAQRGAMRVIRGDSPYRRFLLPFSAGAGNGAEGDLLVPDKLSLSVFLPGSGSVALRDLAIYQYAAGENPLADGAGLDAGRLAGIIGGLGGSLIGIMGAVLGTLTGMGKARGFVLGSFRIAGFLGGLAAVAGAGVYLMSKPSGIAYSLLLIGALLLAMSLLSGTVRARYEALEMRRMTSMDAGK